MCYYQVDPERTREQDRILWNDGQLGPQVMKPQLADIQIVNDDRTLSSLYQPKQGYLQHKNFKALKTLAITVMIQIPVMQDLFCCFNLLGKFLKFGKV